eukprot:935037-Prymnesium_polylepis.2
MRSRRSRSLAECFFVQLGAHVLRRPHSPHAAPTSHPPRRTHHHHHQPPATSKPRRVEHRNARWMVGR